jgi:ATP-dependent helicase/DNAse subunit B
LLTGPAGSGKTKTILQEFRQALASGETAIRLLVPTATLARHLQNRVAREGFVLRHGLIQTLSSFVRGLTPEAAEAPDAVFHLIVEEAARRTARPEFSAVADLPGFSASLKCIIDEFVSAGCDSDRLAASLPDAPLAAAFLAVYHEAERELRRRGFVTRAQRLALAASRAPSAGLRIVWMDGFHVLTGPELDVVKALGESASLTLALGDDDLSGVIRTRLAALGFTGQRSQGARARPVNSLVKASSIERETEEIARRILDQSAAGRPFREMAIIVRAADIYVPLLRTALERFGIPARFYFDEDLDRHAATRCLSGLVDAMLSGWDHAKTLAAMRLSPRFTGFGAMDRFDFAVREQIPNAGLEILRALTADERILQALDDLARVDEWRAIVLKPGDWAERFSDLRRLFQPVRPPEGATHEMALDWRGQAEAIEAFQEAAVEAALFLDGAGPIGVKVFWRAMKSILRLTPLRPSDSRRNVVAVLSAHEARQWVVPVVFVCGMVEKQFPRFQQPDPFFPDAARCRLNDTGIRVRTAAEFEREERALFESAITRATLLTTLSYPEFDARGERNLPSLYLEDLLVAADEARAVRPEARYRPPERGAVEIADPALLAFLREKSATFSPTGLEGFLQCPFQYFATKTLHLRTAPERPEERLSFLAMGVIVHEVLNEWWASRGEIAGIFERVFASFLKQHHIPSGYHTERKRNAMLDDLLRFAERDPWDREAFTSEMELPFEFELAPGIGVRGRIDRIDRAPDGRAYVIDYKYSRAANVKDKLENGSLLQAPLYLIAAEKLRQIRPAGVFYAGLRAGLEYAGWSEEPLLKSVPMPERWLEATRERVLAIVEEIHSGRIAIAPADPGRCAWCDARDLCRIEQTEALVQLQVEGA